VLVGVCLNDIPELQNNLARPPAWLAALYRRSAVVRRAVGARAREIVSVYELFRRPDAHGVAEGFRRFYAELRRLRAEVQADDARLAVAVFPFRFQVEPGAPEPSVQRRLCEFAAREGLECVDLLPVLAPLGRAGFIDACHLSPAGTRAVAQALVGHPALGAPPTYPDLLRRAGLEAAGATELLAALRSVDPGLRAAAVWALPTTPPGPGRDPVPDALLAAARDRDPEVRSQSLRALGRLRPASRLSPRARELLLAALDAPSEPLRLAAAHALWEQTGAAADAPALAARLGHDDPYLAAFVEAALARLGDPALAVLVPLLDSPKPLWRRRAARTLGRLEHAAAPAAPRLLQLLDDPDRGVRRQAARALGLVGPAGRVAQARLEAAARGDDAGLRQAAGEALRRLQAP
jgi:hypothetical protein